MTSEPTSPARPDSGAMFRSGSGIHLLGAGSLACYGVIALLSGEYRYGQDLASRPIPETLAVFAIAFLFYFLALRVALRPTVSMRSIIGWGLLFRLVTLPSAPIQEIDVYRYIWDGAVLEAGGNPFRYSPAEALEATDDPGVPEDLRQLARLRESSASLDAILRRVHYPELPTVYPAVSQAVFGLAAAATPTTASLSDRVTTIKTTLTLFDIATIFVVLQLLLRTGLPRGWTLAYAWCPLVIKEIANSGHLDAIATFLTAAACLAIVRSLGSTESPEERPLAPLATGYLGCVLLAFGAGAKLFPVVLTPLFAATMGRRHGWRHGIGSGLLIGGLSAAFLAPMAPNIGSLDDGPDPSRGLRAFLSRWEMNDFLFMLVIENVRPADGRAPAEQPWFVAVPEDWRRSWTQASIPNLGADPKSAAFAIARLVTGSAFVLIAFALAWRSSRRDEPAEFLRSAFLTIAWFWLLSATQNPWYWVWAMPLLPFARRTPWLAVSALAMLYYLRFALHYAFPDPGSIPGVPYDGARFFDFVIVWLEFAPWFVWLAVDGLLPRR